MPNLAMTRILCLTVFQGLELRALNIYYLCRNLSQWTALHTILCMTNQDLDQPVHLQSD